MSYGHEDHCMHPAYPCKCKMSGVTPFDNRVLGKSFKNSNDIALHIMKTQRGSVYVSIWKQSKDPKIEILFSKPDPDKWDFVECKVIEIKG